MRRTALPLALIAACWASPALAQGEAAVTRSLAATCANCHGTTGASKGAVPSIAGQSKADLVQKMNEFRDGKRQATIMHQIAKGYTPAQIDMIAGWFAQQKAR